MGGNVNFVYDLGDDENTDELKHLRVECKWVEVLLLRML